MMKPAQAVAGWLLLMLLPCWGADLVVTQTARLVTEDMNQFAGTPETLPTGFEVCPDGETPERNPEEFNGVHPGGTGEGACLAWDLGGGDRALGYQPTTDEFTPGCFQLTVSNQTRSVIRKIRVVYDVVVFNNASRSTSIGLEVGKAGEETIPVAGTRYTSAADPVGSTPAWERIPCEGIHRFATPVAAGSRIVIKWRSDDAGGSGSRDEIGIDNVRLSLHQAGGTVITLQ